MLQVNRWCTRHYTVQHQD